MKRAIVLFGAMRGFESGPTGFGVAAAIAVGGLVIHHFGATGRRR